MKERGILFTPENHRLIMSGEKVQTRRVVTPQPDIVYSITDDILTCYHRDYENHNWSSFDADPNFPKRKLHGGGGRENLHSDSIQRIWEEGLRGVVSISRMSGKDEKRIPSCVFVPREQKSNKKCSSSGMYGISRDASISSVTSASLERGLHRLQTDQSSMGVAVRELGGQEGTREALDQSELQIHPGRAWSHKVGNSEWALQPETSGENVGLFSEFNLRDAKFRVGQRLWIKEGVIIHADGKTLAGYYMEGARVTNLGEKRLTAMFMPKWAARTWLEITEVRIERVQDIIEEDAIAEGISTFGREFTFNRGLHLSRTAKDSFAALWNSINKNKHPFENNDWVWCLSFKRIN